MSLTQFSNCDGRSNVAGGGGGGGGERENNDRMFDLRYLNFETVQAKRLALIEERRK